MRRTFGRIGENVPVDAGVLPEGASFSEDKDESMLKMGPGDVDAALTELQMARERLVLLLGRLDGVNEELGHAVTRLVGQEPSGLGESKVEPRGHGLVNEILSLLDAAHDHLSLIEEKSGRLTRI